MRFFADAMRSDTPGGIRTLRGSRIDVHQHPDSRDYNIEGTAELTLETHTAGRPETTGRMLLVVAGAGFEPTTCGL